MNKIIIDNKTELDDADSLLLRVINKGRISNHGKQYSRDTILELDDNFYKVFTDLNKRSDRFVIREIKEEL